MCRGTGDACAPALEGKLKLQEKKEQDGEQNERKKKMQQQEQKKGKANKAGVAASATSLQVSRTCKPSSWSSKQIFIQLGETLNI